MEKVPSGSRSAPNEPWNASSLKHFAALYFCWYENASRSLRWLFRIPGIRYQLARQYAAVLKNKFHTSHRVKYSIEETVQHKHYYFSILYWSLKMHFLPDFASLLYWTQTELSRLRLPLTSTLLSLSLSSSLFVQLSTTLELLHIRKICKL